jgi:hypothetical protein
VEISVEIQLQQIGGIIAETPGRLCPGTAKAQLAKIKIIYKRAMNRTGLSAVT